MGTWKIDGAHSEIGFKVRHLMITTVKGKFTDFTGTLTSADDTFHGASAVFSANVASVNTGNTDRDAHLRSADFFNAEQFPVLSFVSKTFTPVQEKVFDVVGDLTLHGVTKEVQLRAELNGISPGMGNGRVAGFELTGTLSRKDFGLLWNMMLETGGVAVSDEVRIDISAELIESAA